MKKKIKDLSETEMYAICKKYRNCFRCELSIKECCMFRTITTYNRYKEYLNKEIDVNEDAN